MNKNIETLKKEFNNDYSAYEELKKKLVADAKDILVNLCQKHGEIDLRTFENDEEMEDENGSPICTMVYYDKDGYARNFDVQFVNLENNEIVFVGEYDYDGTESIPLSWFGNDEDDNLIYIAQNVLNMDL